MVEYYTGNLGRIHYRTPSGEVGSRAFWGESALRAERASLQSKGYVETGVTYTSMSGKQVVPQPTAEQPTSEGMPLHEKSPLATGRSGRIGLSGYATPMLPRVTGNQVVDEYNMQRFGELAQWSNTREQREKQWAVDLHKTNVAGSLENYDAYLRIVRSNSAAIVASHAMAGPLNLDLALASTSPGVAGASEREEILIKQLHSWKGSPESKGDVVRGAMAVWNNPFVQITTAEAGGMAFGKVTGSVSGRLMSKYGASAVQKFNIAQIGAGGIIVAPTVADIGKDVYEGKFKEAGLKGLMFSFTFGSGIKGYKKGISEPIIFGKYKGLTPFEKGFLKGLPKSTRYDPLQKEAINVLFDMKAEMRTNLPKIRQEEPTFLNVKALEGKKDMIPAVKNQLRGTRSEGYGGAFTEKPSTHDIDIGFKSAKEPVVLEHMSKKIIDEPSKSFADIHELVSPGKQVGIMGAAKEPSYLLESGVEEMQYREQFFRLGETSINPAPKRVKFIPELGREQAKDIPETVRMLDLIYSKAGGVPKSAESKVVRFKEIWAKLDAEPRVMTAVEEDMIYGSGMGKRWWEFRQKIYKKVLSEKYLEKKLIKYTENQNIDKITKNVELKAGVTKTTSRIPPSPSMSMTPPASSGSAILSGLNIFSNKKSRSKSQSFNRSISISIPSNLPTTSKTSSKYKPPSLSPPPYSPPPSSPRKSSIRSPPPSSPPPPSSSPPSYPPSSPMSSISYPPIIPYPKLHGKGSRGFSSEWNMKKYRFRKANIGLPYDMMKKMDIKVKNI